MPLFDFMCNECDDVNEVLILKDDREPTKCEKCGGELRKLFGTPKFIFKGSGFCAVDHLPQHIRDTQEEDVDEVGVMK